jgi:hypothetical protein
MKEKDHIILMADIINSQKTDQKLLMHHFQKVTNETNLSKKKYLLSPLTITLGDEFQGIIENLESALQIIFHLEEKIIQEHYGFQLRYVVFEGEIDTPINKDIAYGMLGDGLTNAREALVKIKNTSERYFISLRNKNISEAVNKSMLIYQSITDDWKVDKDYELITSFIHHRDYKAVAEDQKKTRSQIWKRKKNLKIEEYFAIKEVVNYITHTNDNIAHHHLNNH